MNVHTNFVQCPHNVRESEAGSLCKKHYLIFASLWDRSRELREMKGVPHNV